MTENDPNRYVGSVYVWDEKKVKEIMQDIVNFTKQNDKMMDYEKLYKDALERAKIWRDKSGMPIYKQGVLDDIFPELKESEDEKIRKEILEYFQQFENEELRGVDISDWIAWLKKQGEQKSEKVSIWKHWKDGIAGNGAGKQMFLIKNHNTYSLSSCLSFECDYIELSELDKLMEKNE